MKFFLSLVLVSLCTHTAQADVLALGHFHSLMVMPDGNVWAAGYNNKGQLGDGSTTDTKYKGFVKVPITGVQAAAAGAQHTMVLKQDGSVWAAGSNRDGQLGDGSIGYSPTSSFVKVITSGAKAVAAGRDHSMVAKQDGSLWATGSNWSGQLGGGGCDRSSFVKVISSGVKAVAAGGLHTMVVKQDGSVWGAGYNGFGQLGDGSNGTKVSFVKVVYGDATAVAAGDYHSMVLTQDGNVRVAGSNEYGQLGDGLKGTSRMRFVTVIYGGAKAVAAGSYHSMVLKQDGSVWVAGANNYGQLGVGQSIKMVIGFTQVPGLTGVKTVAAGGLHSMVLKQQDGSVWATGRNQYGQLGDKSKADRDSFGRMTGKAEDSSKEQLLRSGSGGSGDGGWVAELGAVYGSSPLFLALCAMLIMVAVCRNKARQEQPVGNGHAIQRADIAMAGVVDVTTENSIVNVPTATEIDPPIVDATLVMPPASEDMDLPVAVAQAV